MSDEGRGGSVGRRSGARIIPIRLLEGTTVLAESLQLFLETQPDFEPVTVADPDRFLSEMPPGSVALISTDTVHDGLWTLTARVPSEVPGARVGFLVLDRDEALITQALAEGVTGILHQRADPVSFVAAIRAMAEGETVILGAHDAHERPAETAVKGEPSCLTPRELQVIRLVAEDKTAQQVASALGLSRRTINVHLQNAYRKLGVHGKLAAIRKAAREGFVDRSWVPGLVFVAALLNWIFDANPS
jgi:DNA-binding NarL/FixJ family response regulator